MSILDDTDLDYEDVEDHSATISAAEEDKLLQEEEGDPVSTEEGVATATNEATSFTDDVLDVQLSDGEMAEFPGTDTSLTENLLNSSNGAVKVTVKDKTVTKGGGSVARPAGAGCRNTNLRTAKPSLVGRQRGARVGPSTLSAVGPHRLNNSRRGYNRGSAGGRGSQSHANTFSRGSRVLSTGRLVGRLGGNSSGLRSTHSVNSAAATVLDALLQVAASSDTHATMPSSFQSPPTVGPFNKLVPFVTERGRCSFATPWTMLAGGFGKDQISSWSCPPPSSSNCNFRNPEVAAQQFHASDYQQRQQSSFNYPPPLLSTALPAPPLLTRTIHQQSPPMQSCGNTEEDTVSRLCREFILKNQRRLYGDVAPENTPDRLNFEPPRRPRGEDHYRRDQRHRSSPTDHGYSSNCRTPRRYSPSRGSPSERHWREDRSGDHRRSAVDEPHDVHQYRLEYERRRDERERQKEAALRVRQLKRQLRAAQAEAGLGSGGSVSAVDDKAMNGAVRSHRSSAVVFEPRAGGGRAVILGRSLQCEPRVNVTGALGSQSKSAITRRKCLFRIRKDSRGQPIQKFELDPVTREVIREVPLVGAPTHSSAHASSNTGRRVVLPAVPALCK